MIKIKIEGIEKHRNECLFRPYIQAQHLFKEVGVEFVFSGNTYDMVWIGQGSYMNKNVSISESIKEGVKTVSKFEGQDVLMFDGQDSASLMGSYEVFKKSKIPKLLLKNTLYKDKKYYTSNPPPNNRLYWNNILPTDVQHLPKFTDLDGICLSGTNWLSTVSPNFLNYQRSDKYKDIDVFAMFQYPGKENYEWNLKTSDYYTKHRQNCIEWLKLLPSNIKVVTAESGKVPIDEYYNLMSRSKIVIAPFGYGEIAPRDLESCFVGSILVKPIMSHIETVPNIYTDENMVFCEWDYSDLNLKITETLLNFKELQGYYVENMRNSFATEYNSEKMVLYMYDIIKNIPGYC